MKALFFIFSIIIIYACAAKQKSKLTSHPWKVEDAIYETKDPFFLKQQKEIEAGSEKLQYNFKDDGTFTATDGEHSMNGRWNFAKDDTAKLYRDLGATKEILVMRYAPMAEEIWFPWEGQQSIFRDYLGEDGIYAIKAPADESGTLRLIITEKK